MTPDIRLKDFHIQFKHEAKVELNYLKERYKIIVDIKELTTTKLENNKSVIEKEYGLKLDDYKEWNNKEYNDVELLYKKAMAKYNISPIKYNNTLLMTIIEYCTILRNEYKCLDNIKVREKEANMGIKEYMKYLAAYFNRVHKIVLEGGGYKFGHGIGTFIINYYETSKPKVILDFNATRLKKKELQKSNKKIYNENEAAWYKARNIPYDGVPYTVYKNSANMYKINIVNGKLFTKNKAEFKYTDYVNLKYRGLTQQQIADKFCKTREDVYNLQVNLKYKLNILLYKGLVTHLTYVRNTKDYKYYGGSNYS